MGPKDINAAIKRKFPYHSDEERLVVRDLLNVSDKQAPIFADVKGAFLNLILKDLLRFYEWRVTPDERESLRKRLLTLSGMFIIIPIEDLRDVSHRARLTQKKIVYEIPQNPFDQDDCEMHSYDIKYIAQFQQVYAQIALDPDHAALDYIAGNREKRNYPLTQFTVFRKNIQDEVISDNYLTASAEPLTQTQIISIFNPEGGPRDLITIGFDLVYESSFIDFYHHAPRIKADSLVRNSNIMANMFLHSAVERMNYLMDQKKNLADHFPIFIRLEDNRSPDQWEKLLIFITDNLMPAVAHRIRQCNLKLGLELDNQQIEWV